MFIFDGDVESNAAGNLYKNGGILTSILTNIQKMKMLSTSQGRIERCYQGAVIRGCGG